MPFSQSMDAHDPIAATEVLRRKGVDVLTSQDDGIATLDDEGLLARAADLERVPLSQDQDFLRIAAQWGVSLGGLVDALELLKTCCDPAELRDLLSIDAYPLRPIDDRFVFPVINLGNDLAAGFHDDADYEAFLKAIGDLNARRPIEVCGYCLMPNYVHRLILTLEPRSAALCRACLSSTPCVITAATIGGGHVWQGRFKKPLIQDDDHPLTSLRYIEANPLQARTVESADD